MRRATNVRFIYALKNYFDVLQVAPHAEPSVIEAAFRALVKSSHPDASSSEGAHEQTILLTEAVDYLRSSENRESLRSTLGGQASKAITVLAKPPSSPYDALLMMLFTENLSLSETIDVGTIRVSLVASGFSPVQVAAAVHRHRLDNLIEMFSDYSGDGYRLTDLGVQKMLEEVDRLAEFHVPLVRPQQQIYSPPSDEFDPFADK